VAGIWQTLLQLGVDEVLDAANGHAGPQQELKM
jgi:hypothetical protein